MAIRYIRVKPVADFFTPVDRPTGNLAIVGSAAGAAPANAAVEVTDPTDTAPFGANTDLTKAIALAYAQQPGPTLIYGVRLDGTTAAVDNALKVVEGLEAQFVLLANMALDSTSGGANGAITKLATHVATVSSTGQDGRERMGVAMLVKGATNAAVVTGTLASERMIYIAHKSDQDAAAAVAGTIAGYPVHVSLLLKQVFIQTDPFTAAEIETINGQEPDVNSPPAGQGVNWLVDPALIPGRGVYLGEGYTGNPGGKKFIDIVRVIDDVTFKLKARLINSIGSVRITRSGLRALSVQMEVVLDPLVQDGVIDRYEITIPVLLLLDKDPATLTQTQLAQIKKARDDRLVQVLILVTYAGAIHRIAITLKFQ
jgi:hypothetical protein